MILHTTKVMLVSLDSIEGFDLELPYSFCLHSTPLPVSVCTRRFMHSWGSLKDVNVMLFEWVELVNLRGACDLDGVADAINRLRSDFFDVDGFSNNGFLAALTGVFGTLGEATTLLLISRRGLFMAANLSFGVAVAGVFFALLLIFSQLFSLVFIFGDTIRRAVFSLIGVRGEFRLRIGTNNLGR